MKFKLFLRLLVLFSYLFLNACANEDVVTQDYLYTSAQPKYYFDQTEEFTVEVYYEPGAEPYDSTDGTNWPGWDILEENLVEIFSYKTTIPLLNIPKNQETDMVEIESQNKESWSALDIYNLHLSHMEAKPTSSHARFYIYFLNGNLRSEGSVKVNVIGASLSKTPIIAIFKDVIEKALVDHKDLEQATLVHEIGHAIGLVNNGIPMVVDHQDEEHGAHTENENCVMYYANEQTGIGGSIFNGPDNILWGDEVMNDVMAFSQ